MTKINFTDSKQYNLIFKDAKGDMVLTEKAYENLLNKAYKGKELSEYYEIPDETLNEIFEDSYDELGYPRDTTWFIHPEILRDDAKMKALYSAVRQKVLDLLNDDYSNEELFNSLITEDYNSLKQLFNIKYTFTDNSYIADDEFDELEAESEEEENSEEEDENDDKFINSTCKEFLEEYENKLEKTDPRYYLLLMALDKNKGWAYIKKAEDLKGSPELDVVTSKNAKKILQSDKK